MKFKFFLKKIIIHIKKKKSFGLKTTHVLASALNWV